MMCLDYRRGLATPRGGSRASSSGPGVDLSLSESLPLPPRQSPALQGPLELEDQFDHLT